MTSRRDCANAIRALAMDAVQRAKCGHPGMPMGMADIAEVLWRDHLSYNPNNPNWINRDRFILSNGHGAMLHYALLYLTGFDHTIDDIKQFRQLHSRTPGHPEHGETPGIETTTGPLGQGLANGVGMAMAERHLASVFNRQGAEIIDHHTYVFAGDGCLMEGLSHEACSLAGTLGLGKLIVFWDDNGISIDGEVKDWFTDNTPERFKAYHWHVITDVDGHDSEAIDKAIQAAKAETEKPTIICCKTQIGFGAPNLAGTAKAHGAALGEEEIVATRKNLNWSYPPFEIPEAIKSAWDHCAKGQEQEDKWNRQFAQYESQHADLAKQLLRQTQAWLPPQWQDESDGIIANMQQTAKATATRKSSLEVITAYAPMLPELLGGSADLTGSNLTQWKASSVFTRENPAGNYIHYGVREFGMSAIMNGLALHGGIIPFGGTFLTFSDYARNAVRLAALMKQRVIFVYSHDSIGLGEDGPTHQPIEHASTLRLTPDLNVWRPCDTVETAVAWQQAIMHQGPSCLLLTRQNVEQQQRAIAMLPEIAKGGYVLLDTETEADAIIIATGSEVDLAVRVAKQMVQQDVHVRVVSMPCCEVFKSQSEAYREMVLPSRVQVRLAIEAGVPDCWYQFVGARGGVIGIEAFGISAPADEIFKEFGFTEENVIAKLSGLLTAEKVSTY